MSQFSQVLKNLHQHPIAYYRCYASIMGSVAGGVALSQLMFHYGRSDGNIFAKKDSELREETGLSDREMREVKVKLKILPFIKISLKGIPATTIYEIDESQLWEALSQNPSLYGAVQTESHGAVQTSLSGAVQTTRARQRFSEFKKEKILEKELRKKKDKTSMSSDEDHVVDSQPVLPEENLLPRNEGFTTQESLPLAIVPSLPATPEERITPAQLIDMYNALTPEAHPKIIRKSPGRLDRATQYLKIFPERSFWETVFAHISASPFLQGKKNNAAHPNFIADFTWLLKKGKENRIENCLKVFEGMYNEKGITGTPSHDHTATRARFMDFYKSTTR